MGKKVFVLSGLILVIAFISFSFFSGGITGNAVQTVLDTPIISGGPLKGRLIMDISRIPVDSVIEIKLNEQSVRNPVSGYVDSSVSTGMVSFSPEVLLVLEYVSGGNAGGFKSKSDSFIGVDKGGSDSGFIVGDEIFGFDDPPPGNNKGDLNSGEGGSLTGSAILEEGSEFIVVGVKVGKPVTMKTSGNSYVLRGAEVDGEQISFDYIDGVSFGNDLIVDTNYKVDVEGFSDAGFIELDLENFGIVAEQGVLEVSVYYKDTLISGSSKSIKSLGDDLSGEYLVAKSVRDIQKLSDVECESSIEVQKCVVDSASRDVFNDEINIKRITKIIHRECDSIDFKEIKCSDVNPVIVKKSDVEDEVLEIYDSESNLVANVIFEDSYLDIEFLQSPESYEETCHNGIKDVDEEGVDCGGNCSKGCKDKSRFFIWILLAFLVLVVIYFVFRSSHPGKLLAKGNDKLDKGNIGGVVRRYNRLRRLSHAGKLDNSSTKKAQALYSRLRRKLSSKGIKVISDKEKGKLPRLLYRR